MTKEPIKFIDRSSGKTCEETVYGEAFLRWACERPLGRLMVAAVVKRALFSRWYGWRMSRPGSTAKIEPFIREYRLKRADFIEPEGGFRSFNEFFYRRLRPDARPIDPENSTVVFPADGRHLVFPEVEASDLFYAKGQQFDLAKLIADECLHADFKGGAMMISRLCPVDYHRFHFPLSARAHTPVRLSGSLRSVSPIALRRRLSILWENRRERTEITGERGPVALIFEIGATCVGGIHQTFPAEQAVRKGDEKGYFSFGGSCVITLFAPGTVTWDEDLVANSREGIETYALMGEHCGTMA